MVGAKWGRELFTPSIRPRKKIVIDPRNFNYNLNTKLNDDMSVDGLDCTAPTKKKTEQDIEHDNGNSIMPESVTNALHVVINNENDIVMYSDE
ncbi:hypothetical protein EVAR_81163_1 [Eumeta japonica]|uniref:Uncharacterized protein n=1 Tax=Eumeta variegata TaxID=151549 RepID=A0A4C1UK37_EUMVA|nr:hypothetical protein EVAR_81163_1 [Eumeta japonica]